MSNTAKFKIDSRVVPLRSTRIIPGGTRREDPRLTVADLAEFLEVSEGFVRKAIRAGKLHAIVKPNLEYSLTLPAVVAWAHAIRYADAERLAHLERIAARTVVPQPTQPTA